MAGELLGTYDFNDVILIVGVKRIEGFEEGSEITAERDEDSFTKKVGIGGNVTRSKSNNFAGQIKFTLQHLAKDNAYLQALMIADERTGKGVIPCIIIDKSGKEKVTASESWLLRPANKGYGAEAGPREWIVDCANLNTINTNI